MSWDMIDDNADTLADQSAAWLIEQFQYELCAECGGDDIDHTVGPDPLGNMHAYCKPIAVGERVTFASARDAQLTGTVIAVVRNRVQIIADLDAYTSHWILAEAVLRAPAA